MSSGLSEEAKEQLNKICEENGEEIRKQFQPIEHKFEPFPRKNVQNEPLVIRADKLYKYDFYSDKMRVVRIAKVTKKRIYAVNSFSYGLKSIDRMDVGISYYLTAKEALKYGGMSIMADNWMSFINSQKHTDKYISRCEKEGINWRVFM